MKYLILFLILLSSRAAYCQQRFKPIIVVNDLGVYAIQTSPNHYPIGNNIFRYFGANQHGDTLCDVPAESAFRYKNLDQARIGLSACIKYQQWLGRRSREIAMELDSINKATYKSNNFKPIKQN